MEATIHKTSDFIPEEVLVRYRQRNEEGWKRILSMTDVLDKAFVELSLAGEDHKGFNPYDSSALVTQRRS